MRPHFVRAQVRVHAYPDGACAVFLGPPRLADYDRQGALRVPTAPKSGVVLGAVKDKPCRARWCASLTAPLPLRRPGRGNGRPAEQGNSPIPARQSGLHDHLEPGRPPASDPVSNINPKPTLHAPQKHDRLTRYGRTAAKSSMTLICNRPTEFGAGRNERVLTQWRVSRLAMRQRRLLGAFAKADDRAEDDRVRMALDDVLDQAVEGRERVGEDGGAGR
jgi:hypothetical protein